jgi:metalloendopeptidase OMA1, mitochondrial
MGERLSQGSLAGVVAMAIALLTDWSGNISNSISSLFFSLPNSRTQEQEADFVGLLMMAESCYDPEAAVDLWTRMAQAEQFAVPQFISTHPTSYNRRELIKGWLPEAMQRYEQSGCREISRQVVDFKQFFQPAGNQSGRRQPVYQQQQQKPDDDDDFF